MKRSTARTARAGWPVLGLCLALASPAFADPPQIANIAPAGVSRNVATDLTISGANLETNPRLIAPFGIKVEPAAPEAKSDPANWRFKLTVPPEAPVGVHVVRVQTDGGLSNPFLLAVGQLPQVVEAEDNSSPAKAQAVTLPVVIDGQSAGTDIDCFKFAGKKGDRIVVDASCVRIGSGVDPTIRLSTAAGKLIASAEDTPGLLTDARLITELPEDGEYVVELSDTKYAGAGRAVYRLTIGSVPIVDEVYPLGGRRGETVGLELRGGTVAGVPVTAVRLDAPPEARQKHVRIPDVAAGLPGAGLEVELPRPLVIDDLPEVREPADPNAAPVKAAAPVVLNGRIDPAADEDRFVVAVTPGAKYRVTVVASTLGSMLDGTLTVLGPDGKAIASGDDTNVQVINKGDQNAPTVTLPDPSAEVAVPAGVSEITLVLRDLEKRGGIANPYRIDVRPIVPSFEIELGASEVSIPKGGTVAIPVRITRQDFGGTITLKVANAPSGLTVREGVVAAGQALGVMSITAGADTTFGPVELDVVGEAAGPSAPIVVHAARPLIFAQSGTIPLNYETQPRLAAASATAEPAALDAPAGPIEVVHGFGTNVTVKVARTEGADAAIELNPLPLSGGLAVPKATIAEKTAEIAVPVNAAVESPLGPVTIGLTGKGKLKDKDRTLAVPVVRLEVVAPAAMAIDAPKVEIKPGQKAELKGKLTRRGPFKDPVTIKLDGLPAGVKADPVTVAPDATDFTVNLTADAGAAAATAQAKALAAFQINMKDYPPPTVGIEVKVVP